MKESITLGAALDLLVQARVAEACDYLCQRLKSLERIGQGVAWQTTERLELAPGQVPQISSVAEFTAARKEAKQEFDGRYAASTAGGKGSQGKSGKKGKGEDKGKGKRKEQPPKNTGGGSG